MNRIRPMKNTIQEYAWGSHTTIAELLGQPTPTEKPQAELWMGAHPKAPSEVVMNGEWQPLNRLISDSPIEFLGDSTAGRFGDRLPYLLKVLAAARPLSIQAHPSLEQAKEGFARENREGIPVAAPKRNYRDDNHKPEIICALTPFWALSSFRIIAEMLSLFSALDISELAPELNQLKSDHGKEGLRRFFGSLMALEPDRKARVTARAVEKARPLSEKDPVFQWIVALNEAYPGDIGILAPVILNLVCLEPGQALFLDSGELHAYLSGTGIELMANSDNGLRGGLTPKHVDVPELLEVLSFAERAVSVLEPQRISHTEEIYMSGAEEFVLSRITLGPGKVHDAGKKHSIEILLCVEGDVIIAGEPEETAVTVQKGTSVLVPAAAGPYMIKGEGVLYKAVVPAQDNS